MPGWCFQGAPLGVRTGGTVLKYARGVKGNCPSLNRRYQRFRRWCAKVAKERTMIPHVVPSARVKAYRALRFPLPDPEVKFWSWRSGYPALTLGVLGG